ncbi:hypothetical protein GDO81_002535 [Engystomops pustulosus]|uniref:Uncharacterized protein n=1 Tax=Engystomops pustulosus TaxID=76066 RepID=A0AAV7DNM4_ENGPU|nr:hypothetical protein GDO81_002535 [Engystomops pustulosus]
MILNHLLLLFVKKHGSVSQLLFVMDMETLHFNCFFFTSASGCKACNSPFIFKSSFFLCFVDNMETTSTIGLGILRAVTTYLWSLLMTLVLGFGCTLTLLARSQHL